MLWRRFDAVVKLLVLRFDALLSVFGALSWLIVFSAFSVLVFLFGVSSLLAVEALVIVGKFMAHESSQETPPQSILACAMAGEVVVEVGMKR
jgi:hypothetical protein